MLATVTALIVLVLTSLHKALVENTTSVLSEMFEVTAYEWMFVGDC